MLLIDAAVACPTLFDTGVVTEIFGDAVPKALLVRLDFEDKDVRLSLDEVREFRWKYRTQDGNFLVIAKAYKNVWGKRIFKLQWHRIRADGSVSGRIHHVHRTNGRTRQPRW